MTIRAATPVAILATVFLTALQSCASPRLVSRTKVSPASSLVLPSPDPVTVIVRRVSTAESALAAKHLGRLEVAVRSAERPTEALPEARIVLRRGSDVVFSAVARGEAAIARFDSVPSGEYQLVALRVGYANRPVTVAVTDGCRSDVEIYLAMTMIGIDPTPPPVLGQRVTITTCR